MYDFFFLMLTGLKQATATVFRCGCSGCCISVGNHFNSAAVCPVEIFFLKKVCRIDFLLTFANSKEY